jgi:acyl dehydratase
MARITSAPSVGTAFEGRPRGVTRVIASGTQYQGYLVGLLVEVFGEAWLSGGRLAFRLPAVVSVGDTITPKARVIAVTGTAAGCQVELEVWCENQDGVRVLAGSATGLVATAPDQADGRSAAAPAADASPPAASMR